MTTSYTQTPLAGAACCLEVFGAAHPAAIDVHFHGIAAADDQLDVHIACMAHVCHVLRNVVVLDSLKQWLTRFRKEDIRDVGREDRRRLLERNLNTANCLFRIYVHM